jgi:hypothetical protein
VAKYEEIFWVMSELERTLIAGNAEADEFGILKASP